MNANAVSTAATLRVCGRKPEGGFCFVPGIALMAAWFAFRREIIELLDLRVWLACFEVLARRCRATKGKPVRYRIEEIQSLVQSRSAEAVERALARLERAGLLTWSESGPVILQGEAALEVAQRIQQVANVERRIPFPRRLLRELVRARRPVLLATAFGHLLRGMYYRGGQCVSGGRCKASWIADLFEVDVRNVKAARGELERRGWIIERTMGQTLLNRWGYAFIVNFDSPEPSREFSGRSPPLEASLRRQSPPPKRNMELLEGSKNQKPASRRPPGASTWNTRSKPCLTNVVNRDLEETARLCVLYEEAISRGVVRDNAAERLKFFGAAQHARAIGTTNPCGLFVTLVRKRLWSFITQRDEEAARRRLALLEERGGVTDFGKPRTTARIRLSALRADSGGLNENRYVIRETILRSLMSVPGAKCDVHERKE